MRLTDVEYIVMHCSAGDCGDAIIIDRDHQTRVDIMGPAGYQYMILNGKSRVGIDYQPILDGMIHPGRMINHTGAHCPGMNGRSWGICLIGLHVFTDAQLESAKKLIRFLFTINPKLRVDHILGHYEVPGTTKPCPNIPMDKFREFMEDKITTEDLQKAIAAYAAEQLKK